MKPTETAEREPDRVATAVELFARLSPKDTEAVLESIRDLTRKLEKANQTADTGKAESAK